MWLDSYLPLEKSGQSVIDRNLPYRFLRGQPLNTLTQLYFKTYIHFGAILFRELSYRFGAYRNSHLVVLRWEVTFFPARLKYRSQVRLQVTGHRSVQRSDYKSGHRSHTKTIGQWTKLFLIDILLYKSKNKPRNLNYIFSVLNFTKFHTWENIFMFITQGGLVLQRNQSW